MKRWLFVLAISFLSAASGLAEINSTTFLQAAEPEILCQDYIRQNYGDTTIMFTQPTGGAIIRMGTSMLDEYCIAIFCDQPQNRLFLFHYYNNSGIRNPKKIITYGRVTPQELFPDTLVYLDSITPPPSIELPLPGDNSVGKFCQPVDVAVSSCGRYFDFQKDFIYVLDQCNFRVVRLQLDSNIDSLIWVKSFGQDILKFPTAIDYVDYGTADTSDDDIFVVDGGAAKLFRFSRAGDYEAEYGGFGDSRGSFGYPTGVASFCDSGMAKIYVTDSKNHRIQNYISYTDGEMATYQRYLFPENPVPLIKAVDLDSKENVYVVDYFNKKIIVLSNNLDTVYVEYYTSEYGPEVEDFPNDIYIDCNEEEEELELCQNWGEFSGVRTYTVNPLYLPRIATNPILPQEYRLYPNYPNPFNSNTTVKFDLPKKSRVIINVYNILGEKVINLASRDYEAGSHSIIWNGKNTGGKTVASGIYFYKAQLAEQTKFSKMVLLK